MGKKNSWNKRFKKKCYVFNVHEIRRLKSIFWNSPFHAMKWILLVVLFVPNIYIMGIGFHLFQLGIQYKWKKLTTARIIWCLLLTTRHSHYERVLTRPVGWLCWSSKQLVHFADPAFKKWPKPHLQQQRQQQ